MAPGLAHDTDATAAEAAHLWWLVDRPNLFIKIPATEAGLPAITDDHRQGHQRQRHPDLQPRALPGGHGRLPVRPGAAAGEDGGSLDGIESVASFFVSRVDTEIDKRLDKAGADPSLKGKAGVANAQLAYQAYEEVFSSDRWRALEAKGAGAAAAAVGLDRGEEPRVPATRCTSASSSRPARSTPCRRRR